MDPSVIRVEAASERDLFARLQDMERPDPSIEPTEVVQADVDIYDSDADSVGAAVGGSVVSLDNPALARLIGRVMRQDEAALALLYEQLSGRVYAVALRITRQVGCAEEVLQDTFWQVWRQAPRFDPQRGSAIAWVLTMARSRALDAVRAKARDPVQTSQQSVDEQDPFADESADDPLDLLHAVQRDGALHAQLAKLDPLRRQLIGLAFFRGMTHDEIADHTGLPLGTVKSHFRRTLAALQATLGPEFSLTQAASPR
jgi:RNA polymerase sigma factor (sigma-70 family)